ncbi:substrate-binding periplasmic protein [Rhodoferax saidenbachensis]|uniref:substrate-binding periplasmic protein n=1 Tax=Rhodoferax saidenbachensis TaxID=1484693 RepID=UPI001269565C|nr:transporter substrate-binding domain-containing protein [Rhodoferax saidenbachensis]
MHFPRNVWTRWLATVLLGSTSVAWAAPVCPARPITFAFFESGLMYSEKTNDGIDKAVMEELARRSKCVFEFSVRPRARIWLELERGDLMMTGSAIRTDERDVYAWAVNYFGLKAEVMVRSVNGRFPKTKEEFLKDESLKFAAARTFAHGDAMDAFLDELRQRNRVVEVPITSMYEMLQINRFAAMPVYPLDGVYRAKHDVSQYSIASDWFPTDKSVPRAMLFAKKHFTRPQVQEWRTLLQQMRDDGTLRKIYTQYAGKDTADKLMQFAPDVL